MKNDGILILCKQFSLLSRASAVYYHLSNTQYNVGDVVHPTRRTAENKAEEFLEKIRVERYPAQPSRIGCVFVTDAASVTAWQSFLPRKYLYQVACSGNIFKTDGELFSEVDFAIKEIKYLDKVSPDPDDETEEQILEKASGNADTYWQGFEGARLEEILVQGTVQVVKQMGLK